MEEATQRIALTIAGSDSGGGAGIQADLRTFVARGCHGTSVITAVTAQNTLAVDAIHPVPTEVVAAQLAALAVDLPPDACKSGMLPTGAIAEAVASAITRYGWSRYVLDPVLTSTSGTVLSDDSALEVMRHTLIPLSHCVTPNLAEATRLTGIPVRDPPTMARAGEALLAMGARSACITGGHLESDIVVDVLVTPHGIERFTHPRLTTRATHGTGCVLSAAITAGLALGEAIDTAVRQAVDHVQAAMRDAPGLGQGTGPLGPGMTPR